MSKQSSRQHLKQRQTANKQANNLSSKQDGLANKQTESVSVKTTGPVTKQPTNQSTKQTSPVNKQTANIAGKQTSPASKQTTSASAKQTSTANKPLTRKAIQQDRRQQQRALQLDAQRRAARNKRILWISLVVAVVVVVAAVSAVVFANTHKPAGQKQASQNPTALPTRQVVNPAYQPVDGIYCDQGEQLAYHIHVHLTIWINDQTVSVPQSVGIASDQSCFYWLHTHDTTGVVHIESPTATSLDLQQFLDIWGQEFSTNGYHDELTSSTGWTIYVDGKQVTGGFKNVAFQPHMLITIAYNSPHATPDTVYSWQAGL